MRTAAKPRHDDDDPELQERKRHKAERVRRDQEQRHHGPNGAAGPAENRTEQSQVKPPPYLAWSELARKKAPPRQFMWFPHIPRGVVTYLHGFGGVGKSLLAQQIGTAAAFRRELFGSLASAKRVLGWFGEDDHDELWRRQEAINAMFNIDMSHMEGEMFWRPCPGDDITFFSAVAEDKFTTTPKFQEWLRELEELRPELAILDSATQIAAVPEGNRPLVTRCIQELTNPAMKYNTAIILIGHNNREGDYSGSSAWENRSRSRLHMKRTKEKDGAEDDVIRLARPKANYADRDEGVPLEWRDGALYCAATEHETLETRVARQSREREAERQFLHALDRLAEQQRHTSATKTASNYAPRVIERAGFDGGFTTRDLERAMERLFGEGWIKAGVELWTTPCRHKVVGIGRARMEPYP
jgi:RecA-family ATPase